MCESLPFYPIKGKSIVWEALFNDDYIAQIELTGITYTLRVELIEKDAWACRYYINGRLEWENNVEGARTERGAKRQVLMALNEHRRLK